VAGAARSLVRAERSRHPIELVHAVADAVEAEIQTGGRGVRVFPFNAIDVTIVAPTDHARAQIDTIVSGDPSLRDRIMDRLGATRRPGGELQVGVRYVARAQKHWTDPQFGLAFAVIPEVAPAGPPAAPPPRLEIAVLQGAAERRSYAFASQRIDLGRGAEVRDGRHGLIRTNHVAFAENATPVNGSVSRQHAHIAVEAGAMAFRLYDDGSAQGTHIVRNGRAVPVPFGARGVRLQTGDEIVLGEARVRVRF
jgi:hypothetical protein